MGRSNILMVNPRFPHNIGAAVRAMSCFGGGQVQYTGDRCKPENLPERLPREERMKDYANTPWTHVTDARPITHKRNQGLTPIAIELLPGSEPLHTFDHPDDALYVFGPEDGSLPQGIRSVCHRFVVIPTFHCTNLAAAVYLVLYDRMVKRVAAGLEEAPNIDGESRGWWHSPALEEHSLT